jgi:hypothetical protein
MVCDGPSLDSDRPDLISALATSDLGTSGLIALLLRSTVCPLKQARTKKPQSFVFVLVL